MSDALGDRMKAYEGREAGRCFLPMLPIIARIDGKCFSRFTYGMERPFDSRFTSCMIATTEYLVEKTGALAGYTQSDEISLLWHRPDWKSEMFFGGKIFKIVSVCASLTTAKFTMVAREYWPERLHMIAFDCRAFQMPNKEEAANCFLWRELDATKNAISMAARAVFSHNKLMNKNGAQMQEMLYQNGINFNDYQARFKRGTFVLRRTVIRELTPEILAKIPEGKRPTGPIERSIVARVPMPRFASVLNRTGVLFDNESPQVSTEILPAPSPPDRAYSISL